MIFDDSCTDPTGSGTATLLLLFFVQRAVIFASCPFPVIQLFGLLGILQCIYSGDYLHNINGQGYCAVNMLAIHLLHVVRPSITQCPLPPFPPY